MLAKYRDGVVPDAETATPLDLAGERAVAAYTTAMDRLDLRAGGAAAWALVTEANQYIVQTAPWKLAKEARDSELDQALASLARCLYRLTVMAAPIMPERMHALWQALGQTGDPDSSAFAALSTPPVAGYRTSKPPILFPKPEPAVE